MRRLLCIAAVLAVFVSCTRQTTIDIGMLVSLSGNYSPLLVTARNGALLAVEEINQSNSKIKFNLIMEDDESSNTVVVEKTEKLLKQDLDFLIVSVTSAAYGEIEDLIVSNSLLAISPTVSSDEFSGKDDNFIRMTPDISEHGIRLGEFAADRGKRISIVYDSNNLSYAERLQDGFRKSLDSASVKPEYNLIAYDTLESPSFKEIGMVVDDWQSDIVLIIASPFDAAFICQHIEGEPLILLAPWAVSEELLENGGHAVENAVFFLKDTSGESTAAYKTFVESYKQRFGAEPSYQSIMNYDSIFFLYEIMKQQKQITPEAVRTGILEAGIYHGVEQTYKIDKYGDCSNPLKASTIINGKIEVLE